MKFTAITAATLAALVLGTAAGCTQSEKSAPAPSTSPETPCGDPAPDAQVVQAFQPDSPIVQIPHIAGWTQGGPTSDQTVAAVLTDTAIKNHPPQAVAVVVPGSPKYKDAAAAQAAVKAEYTKLSHWKEKSSKTFERCGFPALQITGTFHKDGEPVQHVDQLYVFYTYKDRLWLIGQRVVAKESDYPKIKVDAQKLLDGLAFGMPNKQ